MHSTTFFCAFALLIAGVWGGAIGVVEDLQAAYPAYKFSYGVSDKLTGDNKSAAEIRDGSVVRGSYSLLQPDGVIRIVNYVSTPLGGFQAQVINKGVAAHPAPAVGVIGKILG